MSIGEEEREESKQNVKYGLPAILNFVWYAIRILLLLKRRRK